MVVPDTRSSYHLRSCVEKNEWKTYKRINVMCKSLSVWFVYTLRFVGILCCRFSYKQLTWRLIIKILLKRLMTWSVFFKNKRKLNIVYINRNCLFYHRLLTQLLFYRLIACKHDRSMQNFDENSIQNKLLYYIMDNSFRVENRASIKWE